MLTVNGHPPYILTLTERISQPTWLLLKICEIIKFIIYNLFQQTLRNIRFF